MEESELPEVSTKFRVYERMSDEPNESLNPLYMAKSSELSTHEPRRHNQPNKDVGRSASSAVNLSAGIHTSSVRSQTLGRNAKLASSDAASRRGADMQRPISSVGGLSGSLPSVAAQETTGAKSVPDYSNTEELDETDRPRAVGGATAVGNQPSPPVEAFKPAPSPIGLTRQPSMGKPMTNLPRVNCQEKIVICLDISKEMDKKSFLFKQGGKSSAMELMKKALNNFLFAKRLMNSKHEFALILLDDKAHWTCDFTSDLPRIVTCLDGVKNFVETEKCDLSSIFQEISNHTQLPAVVSEVSIPSFIVRVVLVYGRSHCLPTLNSTKAQKLFQSSDCCCTDVLYIHDTPSNENYCESIFQTLCSLDVKGTSFILTASKNPTKIFDGVAQFLAHPLQRPLQQNVNNVIS